MIQSINLLQATTLELEQMISQEILINPLLEIDEDVVEEREEPADEPEEREEGEADPEDRAVDVEREMVEDITPEEKNWDEYLQDNIDNVFPEGEDLSKADPNDLFERTPTYSKTLEDVLLEQLHDRNLRPAVEKVVRYLIESIDDDGYLRCADAANAPMPSDPDLIEAEKVIRGQLDLEAASLTMREAMHALQMLDPPGVGARNLRECLLIQAWRRDDISDQALEIIEKYFDLFIELEYADIGKAMGISAEAVKNLILEEISRLSLRPGYQAGDSTAPTKVPDMMVVENEDGEYEVRLIDGSVPRLRISNTYRNLLTAEGTSKGDKKYIRDKLKAADLLIKSIGQRKATMLRVMNAIVQKQRPFFVKGPGHLKPLILQDIAEEIGMHISTVNRVTNGKYVQTQYGVFEIKKFFSSGVDQGDGSEVSAEAAKSAIRRLVDNEERGKPLSDDQIVKMLEKENLKLARRTVSKYREQMGILPSRVRKKL